jgi:hypothetical protein
VICVVAFIAVYATFNLRGLTQLLACAVLGLAAAPLVVWWDWPTDEESAKHLKEFEEKNPEYKQRKKDELVSRREEPKPEPLSPELAELAEKIRKKLK